MQHEHVQSNNQKQLVGEMQDSQAMLATMLRFALLTAVID